MIMSSGALSLGCTSQFWSNCYLSPFDHFVKRELRVQGYLRYVDDFALFSDDKRALWAHKRAIVERLARLRLTIHDAPAVVSPCRAAIPWLGFVVHPGIRRVKARNVRNFTRRFRSLVGAYAEGGVSFAELDASVKGWRSHVRFAESAGLERHVIGCWPRRLRGP
jgi:hypothetical protein